MFVNITFIFKVFHVKEGPHVYPAAVLEVSPSWMLVRIYLLIMPDWSPICDIMFKYNICRCHLCIVIDGVV